jgi:hypothetical protein
MTRFALTGKVRLLWRERIGLALGRDGSITKQ